MHDAEKIILSVVTPPHKTEVQETRDSIWHEADKVTSSVETPIMRLVSETQTEPTEASKRLMQRLWQTTRVWAPIVETPPKDATFSTNKPQYATELIVKWHQESRRSQKTPLIEQLGQIMPTVTRQENWRRASQNHFSLLTSRWHWTRSWKATPAVVTTKQITSHLPQMKFRILKTIINKTP